MVYNNTIYYGKGINKLLIKNMLYVLMLLSYTHTTPKSMFQKKQNTTYIYVLYNYIYLCSSSLAAYSVQLKWFRE